MVLLCKGFERTSCGGSEGHKIGKIGPSNVELAERGYLGQHTIYLALARNQSSRMVNVFGAGSKAGDLDLKTAKRVVEEYKDWVKEIDESHRVGFPLYRIFTDGMGTFMSPIHVGRFMR